MSLTCMANAAPECSPCWLPRGTIALSCIIVVFVFCSPRARKHTSTQAHSQFASCMTRLSPSLLSFSCLTPCHPPPPTLCGMMRLGSGFPRCFSSAQTLSTHPHSSTWARTSESQHRPFTRLFLLTVDFMQLIWTIAAILYVSLSHMGLIWGVVCARCVLEGRCDRAQLLVCASAVHSFAFSFLLFSLPI